MTVFNFINFRLDSGHEPKQGCHYDPTAAVTSIIGHKTKQVGPCLATFWVEISSKKFLGPSYID